MGAVRRRDQPKPQRVESAVTTIMGTVVGLTFLFGFGNVLNLALRLGVPVWVAPLVAPAVDLSILGLLLAIRYLALSGADEAQLRPARRLLIFASVVTLALNVADPLVAGEYGKAAFDAVGPLLLIGWAEVGPGLLQTMATVSQRDLVELEVRSEARTLAVDGVENRSSIEHDNMPTKGSDLPRWIDNDLLERAKREDANHWILHRRPISAETLRRRLRIGAGRSRLLVSMVREQRGGLNAEVA
ncbi:hypothetical protein [Actinokineospora sp.]|uniref:hypothetical protein n=1 Tax=Actinokineospora sp. TaxID=1872133 RepID=UPI0040382108